MVFLYLNSTQPKSNAILKKRLLENFKDNNDDYNDFAQKCLLSKAVKKVVGWLRFRGMLPFKIL